MNKIVGGLLLVLLALPVSWARDNSVEDRSADEALLTWSNALPWQVGAAYQHLSRPVDLGGVEWQLKGQSVAGEIGARPTPWLIVYGQISVNEARLADRMRENADSGAGGLLGVKANLWQINEGLQRAAWRVRLQLAGYYAYRTSADGGEGKLSWGEATVMLPVNYHLTLARSARNVFAGEFHSLEVFAGPALSKLDGTWTLGDAERDFEESQSYGVVGGANLWLLENLRFGASAAWFDGTSFELSVLYRF